jgi:UDPglucose 6-dehydrogenase
MQITILGAGYVGLVTGVCLSARGHKVKCVDVMPERVASIQSGRAPFYEPGLDELIAQGLASGNFAVTANLQEAIQGSQLSIIAVPTPTTDGAIDLKAVQKAAGDLGSLIKQMTDYHVVVVKSTVIPGTTDGAVREALEKTSGMKAGEFGLAMNPEFLREGSSVEDFMNPDRIVIGQWDERTGNVLRELYAWADCPKLVTGLRNAEFIKYTSNSLLATLISFSNEISTLCEATPGADVETVMEGLHLDHRLSPIVNGVRVVPQILSYLRAGAGFGGSCLPKDVKSLSSFARNKQVNASILNAVLEVNERRFEQVARMAEQAIGGLEGATIAVLGLAFKPGTDDLRDSPAVRLIQYLLSRSCHVRAYDQLVADKAAEVLGSKVQICRDANEALQSADVALIATACPEFMQWDWKVLSATMNKPVIIDGRNALRKVSLPSNIDYRPIGQCHDPVSRKTRDGQPVGTGL